jgi:CcmD family protein
MNSRVFVRAVLLVTLAAEVSLAQPASNDRSMAFEPGLGDAAHERVPGGRLVIGAYTAAIALLGAYVAYVARRASRLEDNLRRLEDDMTRRGGGGDP